MQPHRCAWKYQLINMKMARSMTETPPPALRALLLWPEFTFWKEGINVGITQTSLTFQGHIRTQPILAPLFQPEGLGDHRILLHRRGLPCIPGPCSQHKGTGQMETGFSGIILKD